MNAGAREPSWALPLSELQGAPTELISALTGDYGEVERGLRDKIAAKAYSTGFEITPAASFRAIQDSVRAIMLTGDNKRTAAAVAGDLGIDWQGELLPQDKQRIVGELKREGLFVAKRG